MLSFASPPLSLTACMRSAPSFKEAFICSITLWQYSSLSLTRSFSRPEK